MGYKGKSLIFLAWQIWPNGFPPFTENQPKKSLPWDFEREAFAFSLSFPCFLKSHLHILLFLPKLFVFPSCSVCGLCEK